MKKICLAFVAALTLALTLTNAHAADFDKGVDAARAGDYATALIVFGEWAEDGNAVAQYNLGSMYYRGEGVAQDYEEAIKWYMLAAEQGDVFAQYNLAVTLYSGEGYAQDYTAAFDLFKLVAEKGEADAQNYLGVMNLNGYSVLQDFIVAHMWFNVAAANGNEMAANNREFVAGKMAQSDISTAQALARECMASNYESCGY